MPNRMTVLIPIFPLLLGGMLALAGPTIAAPAEPHDDSDCYELAGENGDILTYCWEAKCVYHIIESASGNAQVTDNGQVSYEWYVNGTPGHSGLQKHHYSEVVEDGETQVLHMVGSFEGIVNGKHCTITFNAVYANGDVRHDVNVRDCA